jgi:hypothetical protein
MPDRSTLKEKIREEAISHTAWHFTGQKVLEFIQERWRAALGALVTAAWTTLWGYLKGLSRSQIATIGMGTFVVVLFVWDMLIARQKRGRAIATERSGALIGKIAEIRFDYPGSPFDRWEFRSDDPQNASPPTFSAPTERVGGLRMAAPGSHHIDLKLEPHYKVCNRLKFQTKLAQDSHESYVYAKVRVTSKDGRTISKVGWIAFDVGNKPPGKHGQNEWIVYGKPLVDGWTPFDFSLPEEIRLCAGI